MIVMFTGAKTKLEVVNLGLELWVKIVVIVLIAMAVLNPNYFLSKIGVSDVQVSEVSVFGIKLKTVGGEDEKQQLIQAQEDALERIVTLEQSDLNLRELLQCSIKDNCDEEQRVRVTEILGAAASGDVVSTFEGADGVATKIQASIIESSNASSEWVVAAGADPTFDSAEFELQRLQDAGFDAEIIQRGSWFRTIVRFDGKALAEASMGGISDAVGRDVVLFPFSTWCLSPKVGELGLLVCDT